MKHKLYIILLLSISPYTCSTAQAQKKTNFIQKTPVEQPSRKLSSVDSIRMTKYARATSSGQNVIDTKPPQKELIKLKTVANQQSSQYQESAVLKELSNSYWRTQSEIKEAKSQHNFPLLEELELNSLTHRLNYIAEFESIDNSIVSQEQVKLYHSFKKDFSNE